MPTGCVALLVSLGIGPVLEGEVGMGPIDRGVETTLVLACEEPPLLGAPLDEALLEDPPPEDAAPIPEDAPPPADDVPPPEDDPLLDEPPSEGEPEAPLVSTLEEAIAGAPPVTIPLRPTWTRHRVRPRERVTQIAVRYGVTPEDLWRWNDRLNPQATYPRGVRHLRVRARRLPPPRQKVRYRVQEGERWTDISAKFRIETRDLHAYNWTTRELRPGLELELWVDPGWPWALRPGQGPPIPERFDVPQGSRSVGRPHRGRLENGVLLPESDLYTRKVPSSGLYGSTHTIEQLTRAFASFRHHSGYEGRVIIGSMNHK
jgi:hypothetical protein